MNAKLEAAKGGDRFTMVYPTSERLPAYRLHWPWFKALHALIQLICAGMDLFLQEPEFQNPSNAGLCVEWLLSQRPGLGKGGLESNQWVDRHVTFLHPHFCIEK